jgi:hypothetical protein
MAEDSKDLFFNGQTHHDVVLGYYRGPDSLAIRSESAGAFTERPLVGALLMKWEFQPVHGWSATIAPNLEVS